MAQAEPYNSTWAAAVRAAARQGRLSHALILTGEGDRRAAARYIAAAHLCRSGGERPCLQCNACRKVMEGIHPDVTEVWEPERRELPVETVRALRQDVYIRPNEGERKVYLFPDCAQLNERDQNVLLKIVEEGPPYAAFVFCTDALHALLPTVRSRCVTLRLDARETAPAPETSGAAELCALIARGDPLALTGHLTALENRRVKREQLLSLLEGAWQLSSDALLSQYGKPAADETAQALARSLDRRRLAALTDLFRRYCGECQYNVGAGHVLGALSAQLNDLLAS